MLCGNFGLRRSCDPVCNGAWHGQCYTQHANNQFPVLQVHDLEESLMGPDALEEDDPMCFRCVHIGDHLMCPFQCDQCHFYNLQRQRPGAKPQDEVLLMCIRHANLDAFWSRESAMVQANLQEGNRAQSLTAHLGLGSPYPACWAFDVDDSFGMLIACQSLLRSLDVGRNTKTIQFETTRKLWSHYMNYFHTLPGGTGWTTIADGRGTSTFVMGSPTQLNSLISLNLPINCPKAFLSPTIPPSDGTPGVEQHTYNM